MQQRSGLSHLKRHHGPQNQRGYIDKKCLSCEQLEARIVLSTTISVEPDVDGFTNGTPFVLEIGSTELQTQNFPGSELRSALEFDLSSVMIDPSDTITSVRLQVQTTVLVVGNPVVTTYVYQGDETIDENDFNETAMTIGMQQNIMALSPTEFDLTASFVKDRVGTDVLGVLLTTSVNSAVNIVSSEGSSPTERPMLIIQTELTTIVEIDAIIEKIEQLVGEGLLNNGNGNALKAKLEGARQKIANGNNNTAINKLEAFNNQVAALISAGKLSAEDGDVLTADANAVIASLQGDPLVAPGHLATPMLATALSQNDPQPANQQVKDYWSTAGIDDQSLNRLNTITVRVDHLPGPFLELATEDAIRIDSDAAGCGWNIGPNRLSGGRFDLLTAVTHEFGHVLGYHDHHDAAMDAELTPRTPSFGSIGFDHFEPLSDDFTSSTTGSVLGAMPDSIRASALQAFAEPAFVIDQESRNLSRSEPRHRRLFQRERANSDDSKVDLTAEAELDQFFQLFGRV